MFLQPQHFNSKIPIPGPATGRATGDDGGLALGLCAAGRDAAPLLRYLAVNLRTRGVLPTTWCSRCPRTTSAADRQMPPNAHQVVVLAVAMA
jgi:hypothetical protein